MQLISKHRQSIVMKRTKETRFDVKQIMRLQH
jgi:hypothetical protein